MGAQPGVEAGAALGAVEHLAFGLAGPDQVDDRPGRIEERAHRGRAAAPDDVVGILAGGHQREAQRAARAEQRQGEVDQPVGGGEAGGVAVERHHRLGGELPERREVVPR